MKLNSFFLLLIFGFSSVLNAQDKESRLEQAIRLANKGQFSESVAILQKLSQENPADDRVFLSLGLVYRSQGKMEQAIEAFERSVQIKPSEDGFYSLGLLYEALALKSGQEDFLKKAENAWNKYLKLEPQDTKKVEVAKRHLKKLKEKD